MTAESLHVAALPFPTSQGTQAALLAIVRAAAGELASQDKTLALLTYAEGDGRSVLPPNVEHRRTRAPFANRSLRSGPSLAKLAEDAALVRALREAREPRLVAHHVEAGLACVLADRRFTWVAHTALGPELPLYATGVGALAPALFAPALGAAGERLDRLVASRADRVLAVSPFLADRCRRELGVDATVLPVPWRATAPITEEERATARAALGLAVDHEVVLYAGNLDRYQGLETASAAVGRLAHRHGRLRWLVASESDPGPLRDASARDGIAGRIVHVPLATDEDRRRAHAAADVAIVPRRLEAGLSIKILEALAHGLPTVVVRAATGGFPFEEACSIVVDDAVALASAVEQLLATPFQRMALSAAGPDYLARHHGAAACLAALRGE